MIWSQEAWFDIEEMLEIYIDSRKVARMAQRAAVEFMFSQQKKARSFQL
jgi:hypothetical protein